MSIPKDMTKIPEWRKRMSESHKGKIMSKETKKRMSNASIGRKKSDKARKNMSIGQKGKKMPKSFGEMVSARNIRLGIIPPSRKGILNTPEMKQKNREWQLAHPRKAWKDTSIELKIEEELKKREIIYEKQVALCKKALVDFYLPDYKIVIQCDGCYWHNCLIHRPDKFIHQRATDLEQNNTLELNGYKVYRFWEHEINESAEECINRINLVK